MQETGDSGSIPASRRSPGGGHGNTLQYSCLVNPHGQRSLACYSSWGHKESDTTERLSTTQHIPDLQHCANFCYTVKWFSYSYSFSRVSNIEYSSLCYTEGPCYLSILYMIVWHLLFSNSQPFPLPPPLPFGNLKTVLRLCFLVHWQVEAVGVSGSVADQKLQNLPPK